MAIEIPRFEDWAYQVTVDNVAEIPADAGFRDFHDGQYYRPYGFAKVGSIAIIEALNGHNEYARKLLSRVPSMNQVDPRYLPQDMPFPVASFHHRKIRTNSQEPSDIRERQLQLLALNLDVIDDMPPAFIVNGGHRDHPNETGFYVGATHIGTMPLSRFEPELLPIEQRTFKFFPIPRTAIGAVVHYNPED